MCGLPWGALVIKERFGLSDEETVEQIRENPYLEYFPGYESFRGEAPFEASMMDTTSSHCYYIASIKKKGVLLKRTLARAIRRVDYSWQD